MKILLTVLCLGISLTVLAQDEEVTVTSVEVWIQATDGSGKFVSGLKPEDFEVYENGKKASVTCFQSVSAAASSEETLAKERLAIYLDLYNTTPSEYAVIKPHLVDFFGRIDPERWEVFLAVLNHEGKLGMIGPSPASQLVGFLENAKGNASRDQDLKSQRREISQVLEESTTLGLSGGSDRIAGIIDTAYRLAHSYARQEKAISEFSIAAFESLGDALRKKAPDGHTTILYISSGFNIDPGRFYYDLIQHSADRIGLGTNPVQYAVFTPGSNRESNQDIARKMQNSVGKLSKSNITVYSLNTRGNLRYDDADFFNKFGYHDNMLLEDYQDSLARVALDTGGTVFEDSNNFDEGFELVSYDINHHYVLCYTPPERDARGYRKIRVVSKKDGLQLRYRKGYVQERTPSEVGNR